MSPEASPPVYQRGTRLHARARGEGTIFKRKDREGWAAQLRHHGQRHTVYGKTQAEAVAALAELRRQLAAADQVDQVDPTTDQARS